MCACYALRFLLAILRSKQRFKPSEPLSTPLYAVPGSIDFATRVAKILSRRTRKPTYVGCSAIFGNFGIEEEMEGVRVAVEEIMKYLDQGKG